MADNTSNVMLFHTHPLGNVNPSEEDVKTTQKMLDICTTLGVGLLDHIIVNEHHHFSMGSNGVLDPLRNNTARKFNLDLSNILRKWKY